jgi:hypothetical protein
MTNLIWLFIYGLIALVIFLLLKLKSTKSNSYSDGYWLGYEDGYRNADIINTMINMGKEEQDDETTKTEQQ